MLPDEEGFLYPHINKDKCTNCGLCEKCCPIQKRCNAKNEKNYLNLYALRHQNDDILMQSSSGGAFSVIAEYVLLRGGTVVGATYDSDMQVTHSFAKTYDEVVKMRGSKYSQSNLIGVYKHCKEILRTEKDKPLLFSGTPCQVHGLKSYLIHEYENLITMDVVCHSVPSPKVFADYIEYVNNSFQDKLVDLQMRYKHSGGWSHHYAYRYAFASGKHCVDPTGIFNWGKVYFSHVINRPSCDVCPYTNYNRVSDITVADFWDDSQLRPDIYSRKGTSLFIVNTQKGMSILESMKSNVQVWEITEEESMQHCLSNPTEPNVERKYFWKCYKKHGLKYAVEKYCTPSFPNRLRRKLRKVLGLV